ncbi:hypothetical protein [Kitasatospora sp. NPDC056800]|uniref:hypothetical protein n=1 Tax=Kitasatospora sp. NPDC056800 TaxID=3345948 RepID=UPI0036753F5D
MLAAPDDAGPRAEEAGRSVAPSPESTYPSGGTRTLVGLTVNAVHLTLLPSLNGANLVIGHARCGGAEPAAAVPMINPSVAGMSGGAVLAGVLATVYVRRRNARSAASAARRPPRSTRLPAPRPDV